MASRMPTEKDDIMATNVDAPVKDDQDLIVLPEMNLPTPAEFAENVKGGFESIYKSLDAEIEVAPKDISTKKNREAIKSLAYKISKTKVALDKRAAALVDDQNKIVKSVNAERKTMKEKLDGMRDSVREPLTQWETVEAERTKKIEDLFNFIHGIKSSQHEGVDFADMDSDSILALVGRLKSSIPADADVFEDLSEQYNGLVATNILDLQERAEKLKAQEAERAELEQMRREKAQREEEERQRLEAERIEKERLTREAEARRVAQVEAQREIEAQKQRAAEAEAREAEAKRVAEELAQREIEEQKHREAAAEARDKQIKESRIAYEAEQKRLREEADKAAEAKRLADIEAEREAAEERKQKAIEDERKRAAQQEQEKILAEQRRKADEEHRVLIDSGIYEALFSIISSYEDQGDILKAVIKAISKDQVPNIKINY